jgi:hypothetical protein
MDPRLPSFLTAQAAQRLDEAGHFRMEPPAPPAHLPIITPERARELAGAFLHTWGHTRGRAWQGERGRAVDLGSLRLSPRVFYAQTPYGPVPGSHHPAYQRLYGPWYILHFVSGTEPVVVLAVSAYATDLRIDEHGRVRQPVKGGTYFLSLAVSASDGRFVPLTPEEAAAHASRATGTRVADVPTLVLRGNGWHPATAQWKVTLHRPVRVARTTPAGPAAAAESVGELYVGPGGVLSVPAAGQRPFTRVPVLTAHGARGGPPPHVMVDVPRRGDLPTALDEVTVTQEGA